MLSNEEHFLFCFQVKAIATTFAILAQGSAFLHGSQTKNGGSADRRLNDLFAYVAFQASMKNVFPQENSILHDLSPTFRNQSGAEITSYLVDMYINVPVEQWGQILKGHFFSSDLVIV